MFRVARWTAQDAVVATTTPTTRQVTAMFLLALRSLAPWRGRRSNRTALAILGLALEDVCKADVSDDH